LGRQATLSRSMALRVVIILRMTATMMTLGFLLVAMATVREWKKRLEHQAHSRSKSRGGGLTVATGAV
jgi:transposase-like protein